MNFPNIIDAACLDTSAPPSDNRCSDPAFALAHPDVCGAVPVLELKPGLLLTCVLGSVQFRVFMVKLGIETELTSGVIFTSSDTDVAVVGAISGSATGVGAGTVNITATYQGLTTKAKLTVLGGGNCCGNNRVGTFLVLDVSKSMSMGFGGGYSTRLDYAKALATRYSNETNLQKDKVGLIAFDSTPTLEEELSQNLTTMASSIAGLLTTPQLTGIGLALQQAVNALDAADIDFKVIMLVSDGEDKDTDLADDALTIAKTFRDDGGIIIVVGTRAHDAGYSLLNGLATGGFFLNAYPAVAAQVMDQVNGLRGYICAGNCAPPGDVFQSVGKLDYTNFANWNVTAGHVDLIGPGLYDLLPGNGFYVDMAGSSLGYAGQLTSKNEFDFAANRTYRLSFSLAGNQRKDIANYKLRAQIGDGSILLQEIGMPDFTQNFTRFSYSFTVESAKSGNLIFTQLMGLTADNSFGLLLDNVKLEDVTGLTTLFSDTFDSENFVYVPPACGTRTVGYGGGGNPVSNPPAPILVASGDSIARIANPAVPSAVGNPPTGELSGPNNTNFTVQSNGGSMEVGQYFSYCYTFVTATGETTPCPLNVRNMLAGFSAIAAHFGMDVSGDPSVISKRIYRSTVNTSSSDPAVAIPKLWATVSNATTAFPGDTESNASWFARAGSLADAPTSNTTGTSPGNMTPGEDYEYAVSWVTATGETSLSPQLTAIVPAGSHSLIITLPTSVPARVTSVRLWRLEGPGSPTRYYLLAEVATTVLTVTDLQSHADFQASRSTSPAPPTANTTGSSNHPGHVVVGVPTQYAVSYVTAVGETALSPASTITLATGYSSIEVQTTVNPASVTSKRLWRYSSGRYYLLTELSPSTFNYYDLFSDAEFVAQADASIHAPTGNTTGTGSSYFTYYGYNCYGTGCLEEAIGTQIQDPNPLADIEANYVPPTTYTSTKSFTAQCPGGSVQSGTTAVPVMTSNTEPSGTVSVNSEVAGFEGWRAFGNSGVWHTRPGEIHPVLSYTFTEPKTIVAFAVTPGSGVLASSIFLLYGDGVNIASITLLNRISARQVYMVTSPNSYSTYRFEMQCDPSTVNTISVAKVEFIEGAATNDGVTRSATKTSTISQSDADAKATLEATTLAYAALVCVAQYTSTQSYTAKCTEGTFGLDKTGYGTATSLISQKAADDAALAIAVVNANTGLDCTLSNNDQAVAFNDLGPSSPYPSVVYVSGKTGLVTKVTVTLIGFAHQYPSDMAIFLRGPTGKKVLLFRNASTSGGADLFNASVTGINLTFDDAASGMLPQHATVVSGTFKPTQYGVTPTFDLPAPSGPYAATLATFIGELPNGSYSLWCQDFKGLDVGSIAGGWTIDVSAS